MKRMIWAIIIIGLATQIIGTGSVSAQTKPMVEVLRTQPGFSGTINIGASLRVGLNEVGGTVYCLVDLQGNVVWCGCPCPEGLCAAPTAGVNLTTVTVATATNTPADPPPSTPTSTPTGTPTSTPTITTTATNTPTDAPTSAPTSTSTNLPTATWTPVLPTPTNTPTTTPLRVWMHHQNQGRDDPEPSWIKCMPLSAWNGHAGHDGDWMGGICSN